MSGAVTSHSWVGRICPLFFHWLLVAGSLYLLYVWGTQPQLVFGEQAYAQLGQDWQPSAVTLALGLAATAVAVLSPFYPAWGLLLFIVVCYVLPRQRDFEFFCRWHVTDLLALLAMTGAMAWLARQPADGPLAQSTTDANIIVRLMGRLAHPITGVMGLLICWILLTSLMATLRGDYQPAYNHHPIQMVSAALVLIAAAVVMQTWHAWFVLGLVLGTTLTVRTAVAPQLIHLEGDMGVLLSIGMPLACMSAAATRSLALKLVAVAIAILQVALLLKTENRGGMVALIGGLAVIGLMCNTRWRWWLAAAAVPTVMVAVLLFARTGYWDRFEDIWSDGPARASVDSRLDIYQAGWNMAKANPVFGVGLGNFEPRCREYSPVGKQDTPHNNILGMFAELGIVGGGLYVLLFVMSLICCWRVARRRVQWKAPGDIGWVATWLAAAIVAYQFSGMFMTRHTLELAYLLCGGVVALDRTSQQLSATRGARAGLQPQKLGASPTTHFIQRHCFWTGRGRCEVETNR